MRIASYNALSLASPAATAGAGALPEGLAYKVARPALLAKSLAAAEVDAASIQESRCPQGTLHAGPYYRICSGGGFARGVLSCVEV